MAHEIYSLSFTTIALRSPLSSSLVTVCYTLSSFSLKISSFFYYAGYFNSIYNTMYLSLYKGSYSFSSKLLDKGYLEILGPFGVYLFWRRLSLFFLGAPSSLFFNIFFFFTCFCLLVLLFLIYSDVLGFSSLGAYLLSFLFSLHLLQEGTTPANSSQL